MGFLDFLTQPRMSATPQDPMTVTPYEQPQAEPDGLLSAVPQAGGTFGAPEQMIRPPQIEEKPSLLSGVWDYLKSPQNLRAVGAALKGDDAWRDVAQMNQQDRLLERETAKQQQAKEDLARKNAAFKAAYQGGKFNPQAYLEAIGDGGDAGEAFSLAAKLAPKAGVDGGTPYTQDALTGATTWGEQREMSPGEVLAAQRQQELDDYREEQIRLREEQLALARQREGRVARGRPSGGGAPGKLPTGFILD